MNVILLLASTFFLVFALGLQSQLVNNGHYFGAFMNSLLISIAQLGALRIVGAHTTVEYAAYVLGGPVGIVCSMLMYRRVFRKVPHGLKSEPADPWTRDDMRTHLLTLLTHVHVPAEDIPAWTDEQCRLAEQWAGAVHLHASDNDDVVVPPMPTFLMQYDDVHEMSWNAPLHPMAGSR
jgi:hypothetical protein